MINDLKPYPAYEESGVSWLERVPASWRVSRGKNIFYVIDIRSKTGGEELLTVSSKDGVVPRSQKTVTMFKAETYVGHKLCWPGDLVINSLWAWMQGLGFTRHHGLVSSAYSVYRPRLEFTGYARYFHYLLRSVAYKWELQTRSKGVWLSRLQLSDLAFMDMPIVLPPPDEQEAIVRFLDHVDRRIRRYILAKRKLIKLLEEQRQAIVQRAVTRGLDPNVRLKPSGVGWLGDVPEHWEVFSLRRRWTVTDCKHLTVPFIEAGIPLASVREVQSFELKLDSCNHTTHEWYDQLTQGGRKPKVGDLIYCRNVSVGAAALVTQDEVIAMGQDVCLIRSTRENQRWLNYYLRSKAMADQLALILVGSTFSRINVGDIKALQVPVPPRFEQDQIANYLDRELEKIEAAVAVCRRQQTLLREYRTRLIADVVTGKLDVLEVAAELPDELEEPEHLDDAEVIARGDEGAEVADADTTTDEADE